MLQRYQENIGLRARIAELAADPNAKVIMVGVAAVALTPVVLPLVKPVLKASIKTGVTWFEKTKSAIAETGEVLADIVAEAQAEAQTQIQNKPVFAPPSSSPKGTMTEV